MAKRLTDQDAEAFGRRLVTLLESAGKPRRGAGAYLAGKYKVSTVTANDWLNGRFKPNTATARAIAEDHGASFDDLYFGSAPTARLSTGLPTTAAQPVRLDPASIAAVTRVLTKVYGLVGLKLDLTDATDAELFADAYEAYVDMDEEDEADITLTARVINFMNAREARYGAKQRGSDGGDAQEGARRKGAA